MKTETNRILVGGMATLGAILIMLATAEAASIHRDPENISLSLMVTREYPKNTTSVVMLLTSNEIDIIDNIGFQSEYLFSYSPEGKILSPETETAYTLEIGVDGIEENVTLSDHINITGDVEGETQTLSQIPLKIVVNAQLEPLKNYLYRKCFIEEGIEYCADINETDFENITVIEINQTNNSYNVLLPLDTSKEFFNDQRESMTDLVKQFEQIAISVRESTNESMRLQDELNRDFQNAYRIESHLRDKSSPLWYEIEPANTLINTTGLTDDNFWSAIRILTDEKVITEKFEDSWEVKNLPNGGVLTTKVKKRFIASTDRLQEEQVQGGAASTIFGTMFMLIFMGGFTFIYKLRKRNSLNIGVKA